MGIAARIRSRREALHLTQQEVAARVSAARDDAATHQADVSNWERGLSTPSTPVLAPLASALGVSTDWLLTGVGPVADIASHEAA